MKKIIGKLLCFLGIHDGVTFTAAGIPVGFECERPGCKYKKGITL